MLAAEKAKLKVTDATPRIGSLIEADKATLLSGAAAAEIREVLEDRGVIAFPAIDFTDEEQVAFTKTLGQIVDEGGPGNIYKVSLDPLENPGVEYIKGAFFWHIDGTNHQTPLLASLLSARRLAPEGGDTEFCNTYAAYDDLSDEDKALIDGLKVVHTIEFSQRNINPEPSWEEYERWSAFPSNTLPLVWTHRTGRKSLVLGSTATYVEGMGVREGMGLLVRLRDHATQPKYVYRHKWTLGDLVIWDNTGTMHRATPYALDSGRLMHRTKLHGEEPFA